MSRVFRSAMAAALAVSIAGGAAAVSAQSASIPRTAEGHPDFSGIWQAHAGPEFDIEPHGARKDAPPGRGAIEGGAVPYLPAAQVRKKKNFEARETADPRTKCYTLGTPRGIYYPEPFQIFN